MNVLFVVSHYYSGSSGLIGVLNNHPRIKIKETDTTYSSPEDLFTLYEGEAGVWYGDHILHNFSFCSKQLYNICKFIYVIRPPKSTLNMLLSHYSLQAASNHYCFRIRRIYEMAKKTPAAILLTYNDIITNSWTTSVKKYLDLDIDSIPFVDEEAPDKIVPSDLQEAEECYEKYLYRFKSMNLTID